MNARQTAAFNFSERVLTTRCGHSHYAIADSRPNTSTVAAKLRKTALRSGRQARRQHARSVYARDRCRRGEVEKSGRGTKVKAENGVLVSSGRERYCVPENIQLRIFTVIFL